MGTAQSAALSVQAVLEGLGHTPSLSMQTMEQDLKDQPLSADDIVLVCTSNTGMGDLPANIAPLHVHITCDFPPIAGMRYGIINLGDSSYPNFAEAGKTLDEALADLGATRVGEPLVLDAIYVDDHDAEAAEWATQWQQQL